MTPDDEILILLGERDATRELLLASGAPLCWALAEVVQIWRHAHAQSKLAYEHWRRNPGGEAYAVYRAAQDRADAALEALRMKGARADALAAAHG
jgi:hypothetical protein